MAVTVRSPATDADPAEDEGVWPFRWTRALYQQLAELDAFSTEARVQLIEGEIVQMSPPNPPHMTAVMLTHEVLRGVFADGFHIRNQGPIALGEVSQPEPDLTVVPGSIRDYASAHPAQAVLVVEVADATLAFDRNRKASMYAKEGIEDYWIVNLRQRQIEVYRDPAPAPDARYGYAYRARIVIAEDGAIASLAAPDKPIKVADLLP